MQLVPITTSDVVALRKESVDRNSIRSASSRASTTSLSARRAWIEIEFPKLYKALSQSLSARRAWIEIIIAQAVPAATPSLSARRAWIEIGAPTKQAGKRAVALRKESVDRNKEQRILFLNMLLSLSARRAWIEIL